MIEQEHAKRVTLPRALRDQVKHQQGCMCPSCNTVFSERELEIHHIKPVCFFKKGEGEIANKRENLVALCGDCHKIADKLVFERHVFLNEVIEMPIFIQNDIVDTIDNTLTEMVSLQPYERQTKEHQVGKKPKNAGVTRE